MLAAAILTPMRAVGLEVIAERHERAEAALTESVQRGLLESSEAARVQLVHGDATSRAMLPDDTPFVSLSNLCFSGELNRQLLGALRMLPRLKCLASLRELALESEQEGREPRRLRHVRTLSSSMSWDDDSRLHIYCA